jgi:hypothetical protein
VLAPTGSDRHTNPKRKRGTPSLTLRVSFNAGTLVHFHIRFAAPAHPEEEQHDAQDADAGEDRFDLVDRAGAANLLPGRG